MTPEEFLEQLNPYSKVFDLSVDYKYTEEQLVLFAKLYHESELKKFRVADVSGTFCECIEEYDLHRPLGGTTEYCTHCGLKAK